MLMHLQFIQRKLATHGFQYENLLMLWTCLLCLSYWKDGRHIRLHLQSTYTNTKGHHIVHRMTNTISIQAAWSAPAVHTTYRPKAIDSRKSFSMTNTHIFRMCDKWRHWQYGKTSASFISSCSFFLFLFNRLAQMKSTADLLYRSF